MKSSISSVLDEFEFADDPKTSTPKPITKESKPKTGFDSILDDFQFADESPPQVQPKRGVLDTVKDTLSSTFQTEDAKSAANYLLKQKGFGPEVSNPLDAKPLPAKMERAQAADQYARTGTMPGPRDVLDQFKAPSINALLTPEGRNSITQADSAAQARLSGAPVAQPPEQQDTPRTVDAVGRTATPGNNERAIRELMRPQIEAGIPLEAARERVTGIMRQRESRIAMGEPEDAVNKWASELLGAPAPTVVKSNFKFDADPADKYKKASASDKLSDVGLSAVKSTMAVPEIALGLVTMVDRGHTSRALEGLGFRPEEAKAYLDENYSPEQQRDFAKVGDARGFLAKAATAVKNPSVIAHTILESLGAMGAGGVAARSLVAAKKASPLVAGAIGEGVAGAGMAAEGLRQKSADGLISTKQRLTSAGSGLGTAFFGALGGKLAQKYGVADVETVLAGGGSAELRQSMIERVLKGAAIEGIPEEMMQSMQEQVWQNIATERPAFEGVPEAGAMGLVTGGVMGGAVAGMGGGLTEVEALAITDRGLATRRATDAQQRAIDKLNMLQPKSGKPAQQEAGKPAEQAKPKSNIESILDDFNFAEDKQTTDDAIIGAIPTTAPITPVARGEQDAVAAFMAQAEATEAAELSPTPPPEIPTGVNPAITGQQVTVAPQTIIPQEIQNENQSTNEEAVTIANEEGQNAVLNPGSPAGLPAGLPVAPSAVNALGEQVSLSPGPDGLSFEKAKLAASQANKRNTSKSITYAAEEHGDPSLGSPWAVVGRKSPTGAGIAAPAISPQEPPNAAQAAPPAEPVQSPAAEAQAGQGAVLGAATRINRPAPLTDDRLKDPELAHELTRMASEAGWATRGGQLIRDAEGNASGRTTWSPSAPWYADLPERLDGARTVAAVNKAVAGEPMTAKERRVVTAMLDTAQEHVKPVAPDAIDLAIEREAIIAEAAAAAEHVSDDAIDALIDASFDTEQTKGVLTDEEIDIALGLASPQEAGGIAQETDTQGANEGNNDGSPQARDADGLTLAGQSNQEILDGEAAQAAQERAQATQDAAEASRRSAAQTDQQQASNIASGAAADAFSMTQPEPVSKAKQKSLDKKKAKAELNAQADIFSQPATAGKQADNKPDTTANVVRVQQATKASAQTIGSQDGVSKFDADAPDGKYYLPKADDVVSFNNGAWTTIDGRRGQYVAGDLNSIIETINALEGNEAAPSLTKPEAKASEGAQDSVTPDTQSEVDKAKEAVAVIGNQSATDSEKKAAWETLGESADKAKENKAAINDDAVRLAENERAKDAEKSKSQSKIEAILADSRTAGISINIKATEAETGRKISYKEKADVAIKDVNDRIKRAEDLLKCLAS